MLVAYGSGQAARWDAIALHGFMTLDTPALDRVSADVALSVDSGPFLVIGVVMCVLGFAAGRSRQVGVALVVVASANLTAQILKVVLAHDRFDAVLGSDQVDAAALPSGHATAAMSLAIAAVLIAPRAVRPLAAALAGAYVLAVSFSILVLGWHFPSDVVAGMLVATGFGCLALAALREWGVETSEEPGVGSPAGGAFEEWAAGAVAAALLGAVAFGVALARGGAIVAYARDNTASVATALVVMALGASLLAGFVALARERG